MEILIALPLLVVPFFFPVVTGLMAKSFGRRFWPWFAVGIVLPFFGCIILLFLPSVNGENTGRELSTRY